MLGPGVITGAADDDPAGTVTAVQAGAQFQYALAWTALIQFPLLAAVQTMVARVGLITGHGFVRVIRDHYSAKLLWGACVLLLVANTFTVAADLAGVGAAVELITGIPRAWIVPIATFALPLALVFGRYAAIAGTLKWLALALFAYLVAAIVAHPHWAQVLSDTFIPRFHFSTDYLSMFVALFGGTISPYMLVWQSAEEVEELRSTHKRPLKERPRAANTELRTMQRDTVFGMAFSQLITYAIILSGGAAIFPRGIHNIESAQQAAMSLQPVGAGVGKVLFAIGLFGSGLLAAATITSASAYAIAGTARWRAGINKTPRQARNFYIVLSVAALVSGAIALIARHPVSLLVGSQVINGLLAPPLLVILLLICNNERIVGAHTNGRVLNAAGVLTILLMAVPAAILIALVVTGK